MVDASFFCWERQMTAMIDLTGKRFGAWTVLEISPIRTSPHSDWICRCDCGVTRVVRGQPLRNGSSTSCGCESSENMSKRKLRPDSPPQPIKDPEKRAWHSMNTRCSPNNKANRRNYYDRGIRVCERWKSYDAFLADMGKIPHRGYTLDRINPERGYEPDNCRWADKLTQARNRRKSNMVCSPRKHLF